ncbi:unnamed protein product [Soboliphyme baturini]|uniref:REM-1 domain-containing protein n=1 Tax=Soboliphyme baturini TaxID=241478 RepID=A0A183II23_9BILA|nr:unnamed protein product [Soboliphyme baturini]
MCLLEEKHKQLKEKTEERLAEIDLALVAVEKRRQEDSRWVNPKVSKIIIRACQRSLKALRLELMEAQQHYRRMRIEVCDDD